MRGLKVDRLKGAWPSRQAHTGMGSDAFCFSICDRGFWNDQGFMNLQERSWYLRLRLEALRGQPAPLFGAEKGRGAARSKLPPGPEPRKGMTKPTSGKWIFKRFERSLWSTSELPRMKWMEPQVEPEKTSALKLKRRGGVSLLTRIAEQHPQKLPRASRGLV